ncbi:MAG: TetR/AcrR family transcriptional regulator C-terminal domain-containing protein [Eubacteriales bacterium]|nr:TetR/AcrR family transcriptional regulator C-terminal domain-containing protein [Eubacteriales bacterium]
MPKNNKLGCSYATQQKLAVALKELMEHESFEKLSVSDITAKCGLHRQTFYYHFNDKYELLDWVVYEELINPFIADFRLDNAYEKIFDLFSTISSEKKFYQNSLKINTEELSRYITKIAYDYVKPLIKSIKLQGSIVGDDDSDETMAAEFLSYGISGVIICWIQGGMKDSPEIMTKRTQKIINGTKALFGVMN